MGPKIINRRQKSGHRPIRTKFGAHMGGIKPRRLKRFREFKIPLTPKKFNLLSRKRAEIFLRNFQDL